jgi:hypothetical protein
MDKRIKCTACRRMKMEEDFKKNQKILKTCISCREKSKKVFLIESASEPVTEPVPEPVPEPVLVTKSEPLPKPEVVPKTESLHKWIGLSGYWIREGEEQKLHKKLTRKLNRQFHMQSAFPIHKYLTRYLMVDIRDRYSPCSESFFDRMV